MCCVRSSWSLTTWCSLGSTAASSVHTSGVSFILLCFLGGDGDASFSVFLWEDRRFSRLARGLSTWGSRRKSFVLKSAGGEGGDDDSGDCNSSQFSSAVGTGKPRETSASTARAEAGAQRGLRDFGAAVGTSISLWMPLARTLALCFVAVAESFLSQGGNMSGLGATERVSQKRRPRLDLNSRFFQGAGLLHLLVGGPLGRGLIWATLGYSVA